VGELKDVYAKLLFTWMIPTVDNLGRMEGEPYQVRGLIFPREEVTDKQIEKWLAELHDSGLIIWYSHRGLRYVFLPRHADHQKLVGNMRNDSDFPAPSAEDMAVWTEKEAQYERRIDGVSTEGEEEGEDKGEETLLVEPKTATRPRAATFKPEIEEVFTYWQQAMGKGTATLTPQRRDKIRIRLKDGYTVEQLQAAIDGCRASPHNMGDNDRSRPFNDIELILRNGTNVEKFMELAPAHRANGGRTWTADDRATIDAAVTLARDGRDAEAQMLCGNDSLFQEVIRRVGA
jgi:hypothetical protein